MLQLKNKSVNWVPSIWHHRDQPGKSSVHSTPEAGAIRTDQSQLPFPLLPHQFFLSGWLPTGGPAVKGECDFLQESLSTRLRTTALCLGTRVAKSFHLEWHLVYLEKGSTWFQPTPCTQVMHLSSEHTLQWTQESSPPKAHLSSSCGFPLRPVHRTKGRGRELAHFLGWPSVCILWHFNLVIKLGYKTTQRLTLDVSWFFPPSRLHGHPCFRLKCKEKVSPKEADTESISGQYIMFLLSCKEIKMKGNSLNEQTLRLRKHW